MNCPKCNEPVETGAAFCGNCGQALTAATAAPALDPVSVPTPSAVPPAPGQIPAYAVPVAGQQQSHMKAILALVLGGLGIAGALMIPLIGLAFGIAGMVLATISHRLVRHGLSLAGIVVSSLAIVVGLGSWAYAVMHDTRSHDRHSANSSSQTAASLKTPCYSISFPQKLQVENSSGSCDMKAYDGDNLNDSSDAYKVYVANIAVSQANFSAVAKQAIEKDVSQSLPGFTITGEGAGNFAGSPAYYVTTSNHRGVTLVEAAALHDTGSGQNFFVFVHAVAGSTADLDKLQAGWQWGKS